MHVRWSSGFLWNVGRISQCYFQITRTSLCTRTVSSDGTQGSEPRSSILQRVGFRASYCVSFMLRIYSPYFEEFDGRFFFKWSVALSCWRNVYVLSWSASCSEMVSERNTSAWIYVLDQNSVQIFPYLISDLRSFKTVKRIEIVTVLMCIPNLNLKDESATRLRWWKIIAGGY